MEQGPEAPSDHELARRATEIPWSEGGSQTFWELWRRHEPWLKERVRLLARIAPPGCPRDLFCDAVIDRVRDNLLRSLHSYANRGPFRAFLNRVAQRAAIDEYRHLRRRTLPGGARTDDPEPANEPSSNPELLDPTYRSPSLLPSPERLLLIVDRREKLRCALAAVAAESQTGLKQAFALRRRYLEGHSLASIAAEAGVVEHTVWNWIRDGLLAAARVLREQFGVQDVGEL